MYYDIENITKFSNEKVIAFAGIGNPSNFFNLLKNSKINVIKEINYPDHYSYKSKDLDSLIEQKDKFGAKLITTEKDFRGLNQIIAIVLIIFQLN